MEDKIKQANPTLHRYLFTVTTFSKILAMILFIILPFIGFYLGMQYQETINPPPSSMFEQVTQKIPIPTSTPTTTTSSIPSRGTIIIDNSGSTNTPGWTLTVQENGEGIVVFKKSGYENQRISSTLAMFKQLRIDLQSIGDVTKIQIGQCFKSASFGTLTTITYNGKSSGDLECIPPNESATVQNLSKQIQTISNYIMTNNKPSKFQY